MEKLEFNIDSSEKNVRIDKYLAECCPDLSRSYLQKLLKDGAVSVNTRIVKANYKTQPGDHVIFKYPGSADTGYKAREHSVGYSV